MYAASSEADAGVEEEPPDEAGLASLPSRFDIARLSLPPRLDQVRLRDLARVSFKTSNGSTRALETAQTALLEIYTRDHSISLLNDGPGLDFVLDDTRTRDGATQTFGLRLWSQMEGQERICLGDWWIQDARYLPRWTGRKDKIAGSAGSLLPVMTIGQDELAVCAYNDEPERPRSASTSGKALKKGYSIEDITILLDLQITLDQLEEERAQWSETCGKALREDATHRLKYRVLAKKKDVQRLEAAISSVVHNSEAKRSICQRCEETLQTRVRHLDIGKGQLNKALAERSHERAELNIHRALLENLRLSSHQLRRECLRRLRIIFPVEEVGPMIWSIVGVPLSAKKLEAGASTALGHLAHLVQLIASYWNIYMIYPIVSIGSRSGIKDPISRSGRTLLTSTGSSVSSGTPTFPLYPRGTDRYRFEYAVFLLGKDLEQICQQSKSSLQVKDARNLVANLVRFLNVHTNDSGLDAANGVKLL